MENGNCYKVILIFTLKTGAADEELRRSQRPDSFQARLAQQEGFVEMDLVKVDNQKTISIQTWETAGHWWKALETVKQAAAAQPADGQETIHVSREFLGGPVMARRSARS